MAPRKEPPRTLLSALVYGCLLFHLCGGQCPGDGTLSPVLDDKVAGSDVVVQGQVVRRVKAWDSSYTAELSVQCVYKGGPVPSLINVTRAGTVQGQCVRTTLSVGSVNLVYLRRSGDRYTPAFTEDPADTKYLEELRYVCGLSVQLPTGASSASSASCQPDKFSVDYYNDCPDTTTGARQRPSPLPSAAHTARPEWTMLSAIGTLLLAPVVRFL